ncbi:MAG: hypothetical protein GY738_23945, partial [Pseudoalteromonas sp.]|nr:hypothetical protein [Pseudoalteromonas sp.]
MAIMITDLNEIETQDENDLLVIYDKLQEKTSTIKASKFRGGVTHISVNDTATPPVVDMTDAMFTGLLIKPNDFWRDDTTAVDGSYREYQALSVNYGTNVIAWSVPVLYTPREPFVFPAGEQASDYAPPTDQADALFNGLAIIAGDRVRWQVTGSTTDKEIITTQCIVNADDSLDWGANHNAHPTKTHASGVLTHPEPNDADYAIGDFIEGSEGSKYGPYVEGETDPLVAWPLYRQRTVRQYELEVADSDELIDLNALNALIDTWTPYPFAGDKLLVSIMGHPRQQLYTIRKNDETDDNYRPTNGFQLTDGHNPKAPITYNEPNAVWPARNDNHYSAADFIRAVGNDFMFGPYVPGRTNDVDAWPLMDRRTVRTFDFLGESGGQSFIADNAATYTVLNDMSIFPGVIAGDKIILTTTDRKRVQYDIHRVDSTDEVYLPASGFVAVNRSNPDEPVTHHSDADGYPAIDDETIRVGDYHRTVNGNIFGPYVELQSDEALAWPLLTARPVRDHQVGEDTDAAIRAYDAASLTNPVHGDSVTFTLPTGKIVKYTVSKRVLTDDDFNPDGGFELVNRRNGRNAVFHKAPTAGQPVRNEDLHGTGDTIISTDGIIYGPYTEQETTDALAAPTIV